jgi:2',3'-cyclic-nucleotide 2'-phosphodiesterase (5'-nucleotidase family)
VNLSRAVAPERRRPFFVLVALIAALAVLVPAVTFAARPTTTTIQILNVSDWHSNLDPLSGIGGAWNISARWQADRVANPNTLTLTAGDDFGASPPLSGFFNEEPGVKAERMMGIQVNTFGNHDFDRGLTHLQSMINLAGAASTGNTGAAPGQPFSYVATNLANLSGNLTGVERLKFFTVGGVKVAVIGVVNEEAPSLVAPGNFGTIEITDGVAAANQAAKDAKHAGAQVVAVITHKGVEGFTAGQPHGPLITFSEGLQGVDIVFGDHTNVQYSGTIIGADDQPILVHENLSFGLSYAKTQVNLNSKSGKITGKSVSFVSPTAGSLTNSNTLCPASGFCDQAIVDMLVPYRQQLSALLDGQIATTTVPYDRGGNLERRQETPLGNLIADGMRATYGTQIGYMNSGGIRTQFPSCTYAPANTALNRSNWNAAHNAIVTCSGYASGTPYDIVKGDVYAVMPFGNNVLTRSVTGIQLWQMLENGVAYFDSSGNNAQGRFPDVSGIKFTFHYQNPTGCSGTETGSNPTWACTPSRVTAVSFSDGTSIPYDGTTYTVATIDFLNNGGDSYTMLKDGQGATRDRDANVFLAYIGAIGPTLDPTTDPLNRITKLP